MKTVFDITDYREACKFLQDKYDALGYERKDYYHTTGADQHLTKTSNIGHGDHGLQYHHICEDIVPSLSAKEKAEANQIEYQAAENMCYCNLIEHAWLHVLITEANAAATDEDQADITGLGGVKWMFVALNSIYADPETSWYSKKTYEESKIEVDPENITGMTYNYNNIITDNKDLYFRVVNRFCTSAFIRQRLNLTPAELAAEICLSCRKDASAVTELYADIMAEAKTTKLFEHNVGAFADLENYLKTNPSALVYICTSGGKTTTGLEYLRIHNCKALALGPSDTIKTGWEDNANVKAMNYQAFMNEYITINYDEYPVVICDEAHHVKADRWGEGIRWILANRPDVKIIGLTATPTEAQFNGTDAEFGGRICYGLDLADGISNNTIWPFGYIQSIYRMEDVKDEFDKYGTKGTLLWERLNLHLNANPVQSILAKHMPTDQRKIIVFCQSTNDLDYAEGIMKAYDATLEIRRVTSKEDKSANEAAKNWFNDTVDKNVCILTVNMVNEGAHYKGVNTLVMFRRTHSTTLYIQQLGRLVANKAAVTVDPNGIVFDFTNNAENLIHNATVQVDDTPTKSEDRKNTIDKIKRAIQSFGSEVICQDYTEDCAKTLAALNESKDSLKQCKTIYNTFSDTLAELASTFTELFDMDLWADLKTRDGKVTAQKTSQHAGNANTRAALSNATGATTGSRTTAKASDPQKLAEAYRLAIKRAYNFGYVDFTDDHAVELVVHNKSALNRIVSAVGFRSAEAFELATTKLGKHAFLIATSL